MQNKNPELLLSGFNKVDRKTSPEELAPTTLAQLDNAVLTKTGSTLKIAKRGGWTRIGYGDLSNAGADGTDVIWAKEMLDENDLMIPMVMTNAKKLKKHYSSAWSTVKTFTTGGKLKTARFNKKQFLTNGNDAPIVLSGAGLATEETLELERPVIPVPADASEIGDGGHLEIFKIVADGNMQVDKYYMYCIVYETAEGQWSAPSRPFTDWSFAKQRAILNLPVPTDTRITKKVMLRTEGNGKVFYVHSRIDPAETEFFDNVADADLQASETINYLETPVKAKYICSHRNRLWAFYNTYSNANNFPAPYIPVTAMESAPSGSWTRSGFISGYNGSYVQGDLSDPSAGGSMDSSAYYRYRVYTKSIEGIRNSEYSEFIILTGASDTRVIFYWMTPAIFGASSPTINDRSPLVEIYRSEGQTTYLDATTAQLKFNRVFDPRATNTDDVIITGNEYISFDGLADASLGSDLSTTADTTTTYPSSVCWSDVDKPNQFSLGNRQNIDVDDNGYITGAFDDNNGVIVFKQKAVYKIYTDGINFRLVKLVENIGCDDPDSLAKSDGVYFFKYQNKFYALASESSQPEPISIEFQPVVDLYEVLDAVATREFYACAILNYDVYAVAVFDRLLNVWYYWTISNSQVLYLRKYSSITSEWDILGACYSNGSNAIHLTKYNPTSIVDSESGANADISIDVKTKRFKFPDGFYKARLLELFCNYNKVSTKNASIALIDEDGTTMTFTDSTGSGIKTYARKMQDSDTFLRPQKIQIAFSGVGFTEIYDFKLVYRILRYQYGS